MPQLSATLPSSSSSSSSSASKSLIIPLHHSRRCLLLAPSIPFLGLALALGGPAIALASPPVPAPTNPLILQLLERTRANKAKNDQERLDSYYERNFKDYFEFVEGTIRNKTDLTDAEKGILRWLEKSRSKKK